MSQATKSRKKASHKAAPLGQDEKQIVAEWTEKLRGYRERLKEDPQFNPIKQLAFTISRELESKSLSRGKVAAIGKHLCDQGLLHRAQKTRDYMGSLDTADRKARLKEAFRAQSMKDGQPIPFEEFRDIWQKPLHGIVYTAHPTFVMSVELRKMLVSLIEQGDDNADLLEALASIPHRPDDNISLQYEHDQVQEAISHARSATLKFIHIILEVARELYPDDWWKVNPSLVRVYSWVGYDLDGRTDIRWFDSFRFRLKEKLLQISFYQGLLEEVRQELSGKTCIIDSLAELLEKEQAEVLEISKLFSEEARDIDAPEDNDRKIVDRIKDILDETPGQVDDAVAHKALTNAEAHRFSVLLKDKNKLAELNELLLEPAMRVDRLENPNALSRAANALTQRKTHTTKGYVKDAIALLNEELEKNRDDETRFVLAKLRSHFSSRGMSTAHIHIRINAMQLHNAIRGLVDLDGETLDLNSHVLLNRLDSMIQELDSGKPQTVNFASVALERTTAIRQFMIVAQILKHIDGDSPIRMLIAECEHAFTVLSAVYFAKLFGVSEKIDISPLFETEEALENGVEVIKSLLKLEGYRNQVELRKRLCIQTGFSDAGRFIGQIPAALSIERLQAKLARVMGDHKLNHIDMLIFDTHGESMGRGTHPGSLAQRFNYTLSPYVRATFAKQDITLLHEVSFQGGDGYILFGSDRMAFATLSEMLLCDFDQRGKETNDLFYDDIDFSMDFFKRIKRYQIDMFENSNYSTALSAFSTNLLSPSGSRKSKRQFDGGSDSRTAPAEMRAIPHNAILQQMGYLVNIVSGIGEAVRYERERFSDICSNSERARSLMTLVGHAYKVSGIKTLVAYSSLFDDAFWVTRPIDNMEEKIKGPCLYLADLLRGDERHDGLMHLATYLREDDVHLQDAFRMLNVFDDLKLEEGEHTNSRALWLEQLDIIHALRIAMIQHIYLKAAKVPQFSSSDDITHKNVMKLILSLYIDQAVTLMREAYPLEAPQVSDYKMEEEASYISQDEGDYATINHKLIEPIEESYQIILDLGIGVSHFYRAHG